MKFATALIGMLCVAGCGGGGSALGGDDGTGPVIAGPASNVQTVTVDTGPAGVNDVNTLFTTVTICVPGTTSCETIDHIQVDTGSSGLRIIASALSLTLPAHTDASSNILAECTQFIDGYSWGPLALADVKISGETAPNIAVQVIGDPGFTAVPTNCSNQGGTQETTVTAFGANGILGVGPFISDCGPGCAAPGNTVYYACTSGTACQDAAVDESAQVSNPVAFFATDNNGVIVELPTVAAGGTATVSGSLVFGIGTQSNNGLGTATVLPISASDGSLTATYKGNVLNRSFIDSGSNALYFPDSTIAVCASTTRAPGFFCPTSTQSLSATLQGVSTGSKVFDFSIANADTLFFNNPATAAAINLGAPNSDTIGFSSADTFDFGLPLYFGRNVFTAIEGKNTAGGMGPYFAL